MTEEIPNRELRRRLMALKDAINEAYFAARGDDLAEAKERASDVAYEAGIIIAEIEREQMMREIREAGP